MKRIQNIIKTSVVIALLSGLSSCYEDYPEGPGFDLRSENARICATWQVDEVVPDEEDFEMINTQTRIYIQDGGDFSIRVPMTIPLMGNDTSFNVGLSGKWEWADGKKSFSFRATELTTGLQIDETGRILRLEYENFWYEMTDTASGKAYTIKCKRM